VAAAFAETQAETPAQAMRAQIRVLPPFADSGTAAGRCGKVLTPAQTERHAGDASSTARRRCYTHAIQPMQIFVPNARSGAKPRAPASDICMVPRRRC